MAMEINAPVGGVVAVVPGKADGEVMANEALNLGGQLWRGVPQEPDAVFAARSVTIGHAAKGSPVDRHHTHVALSTADFRTVGEFGEGEGLYHLDGKTAGGLERYIHGVVAHPTQAGEVRKEAWMYVEARNVPRAVNAVQRKFNELHLRGKEPVNFYKTLEDNAESDAHIHGYIALDTDHNDRMDHVVVLNRAQVGQYVPNAKGFIAAVRAAESAHEAEKARASAASVDDGVTGNGDIVVARSVSSFASDMTASSLSSSDGSFLLDGGSSDGDSSRASTPSSDGSSSRPGTPSSDGGDVSSDGGEVVVVASSNDEVEVFATTG